MQLIIFNFCLSYYVPSFFIFRAKKSDLEDAVLKQILKSAKAFESASIDQRAFLRSRAQATGVDLNKFVNEIKDEMKQAQDEMEGMCSRLSVQEYLYIELLDISLEFA